MATQRFSCEWKDCGELFEKADGLKKHREEKHEGRFQCDVCQIDFKRNWTLTDHKHKNNHFTDRDPSYPCPKPNCTSSPCRTAYALEQHLEASHPELAKPKFHCRFLSCEHYFTIERERNRHEANLKHHSQQLKCPLTGCAVLFDNHEVRSAHLRAHEPSDTPFLCNEKSCGAKFATLESQFEHEEHVHHRSNCRLCGNSFRWQTELFSHFYEVHVKREERKHLLNADHSSDRGRWNVYTARDCRVRAEKTSAKKTRVKKPSAKKAPAKREPAKKAEKSTIEPSTASLSRVKSFINAIQGLCSKEVASATHSDIPVSEQASLGTNLQRFQDRLLALPDPILGDTHAINVLQDILEAPSVREVEHTVKYVDKQHYIDIRVSDVNEHRFSVSYLHFADEASVDSTGWYLAELLSRIPAIMTDLDRVKQRWVLNAAYRLATHASRYDPDSTFTLSEPYLQQDEDDLFYYEVLVTGFDPAIQQVWSFPQRIYTSVMWSGVDLDIVEQEVAKYQWQPEKQQDSLHTTLPPASQLSESQNIAKWIYIRYSGWLGNMYDCATAIGLLHGIEWQSQLDDYKVKPNKALVGCYRRPGKYRTQFQGGRGWIRLLSLPESNLRDLDVWSFSPEHLHPCVSALLNAIQSGQPPTIAWGMFCAAVDCEQDKIKNNEPSPIVSCTGCEQGVHICPLCLYPRDCNTFKDVAECDFKICSKCGSDVGGVLNRLDEVQKQAESARLMLYSQAVKLVDRDVAAMKSRYEIDEEQFEKLKESIFKDVDFFLIDETSVADSLITQDLQRQLKVKLTWDKYRSHPKTPSVDGFLAFVRGTDDHVMYHYPGNVSVTSDSINRLFRNYPKFLAHGFRCMVTANDYDQYSQGLRLFQSALINHHELKVLGHDWVSSRLGLDCDSFEPPFDDLLDAQKYCKPLPRTIQKSKVWRTRARPVSEGTERDEIPNLRYMNAQIRLAAQRKGLDSPELESTWLRNGVFFPFAQDAIVTRWTDDDLYQYFDEKLTMMRNTCDRMFKNQANRPKCSVQELTITVAYLHMSKVVRDLEAGRDIRLCGRDQAGLLLYPTKNWLLSASIGHDEHGKQMLIGLTGWNLKTRTGCEFDPAVCNILWETWGCNCIKFNYHPDYYPEIFEQLHHFRTAPILNAPVGLPLAEKVFKNVRDFTNELTADIDGKAIDPDDVQFDDGDVFDGEDIGLAEDNEGALDEWGDELEFRCPCGDLEMASAPARELISCHGCGEIQHRACMNVPVGQAAKDYACELCDEERYEGFDWSQYRKVKPVFRCFCTVQENLDIPSQMIIQCGSCRNWQHCVCMGIDEGGEPTGYLCEVCDPVRYQALENFLSTLLPPSGISKPSNAVSKPAKRKMGRLKQTCYISAATQLVLSLSKASKIVAGDNTFRITGREPAAFSSDPKHYDDMKELFGSLSILLDELQKAGPKLSPSLTRNLLQYSTIPRDYHLGENDHLRYRDVQDNAAEYFAFLVEKLIQISDTSPFTSLVNGLTEEYQSENKLQKRAAKGLLNPLADDIKSAITAYQNSGFRCGLAQMMTVHMVRESECLACDTILRKFQHNTRLLLKLPDGTQDDATLTLADFKEAFYTECLTANSFCPSCDASTHDLGVDHTSKKWSRSAVRLINAPELLVFEINQFRTLNNSLSLGKSRVHAEVEFDLKDWQSENTLPSAGNSGFALEGRTRYRCFGVLAYLGDYSHWVAFVDEDPENPGKWICYDDTKPCPTYQSPEDITQPGFCECLIVYRKIKEPTPPPSSPLFVPDGQGNDTAMGGTTAGENLFHGLFGDDEGFHLGGDDEVDMADAAAVQIKSSAVDKIAQSTETAEQKLAKALETLEEKEAALVAERTGRSEAQTELQAWKEEFSDFAVLRDRINVRTRELNDREREFDERKKEIEEDAQRLIDRNAVLLEAVGVEMRPHTMETWSQTISEATRRVAFALRLLERLGLQATLPIADVDSLVESIRGSTAQTDRELSIESIIALLRRTGDRKAIEVLWTALARFVPEDSARGKLDAIYQRLIVPIIESATSPLAAWDMANEHLIRPILRRVGETQTTRPSAAHNGSDAASTDDSLSSKLLGSSPPVPETTLTGTTTRPSTSGTIVPRTPTKSIRTRQPAQSPSSPLTSRERAGDGLDSKKRYAAKDRFAGQSLKGSIKSRRTEPDSEDDSNPSSPLKEKTAEQAESMNSGRPIPPDLPRKTPRRGLSPSKSMRTLRARSSRESFMQPTQSSRNRSIFPQASAAQSTPRLVPGRHGDDKTRRGLRTHIKDIADRFKSPTKKSSSDSKQTHSQGEKSGPDPSQPWKHLGRGEDDDDDEGEERSEDHDSDDEEFSN